MAGIIAASFGGGRLVGVGPNLALASYNVFEDTGQFDPNFCPLGNIFISLDSSVWSAMLDAAERGFKVINISLGDILVTPDDLATISAWNRVAAKVIDEGVTIVASGGNDGINLNGPIVNIPSDLPGVIAIGATGIRPEPLFPQDGAFDVRAFYSNFGQPLDLVAPGGDFGPNCVIDPNTGEPSGCDERYLIMTTDVFPIDAKCAAAANCTVGYFRNLGTSFAAPHVAAVAGLILDTYPYLNQFEVTKIIGQTAERIGDPQQFGSGIVDAYRAVGGR